MKARVLILAALVVALAVPAFSADEPVRMSKDDLRARLDDPDVIVLDVRLGTDWRASEFKIKGAIRREPEAFDSWYDKYPRDKTLVLYCA